MKLFIITLIFPILFIFSVQNVAFAATFSPSQENAISKYRVTAQKCHSGYANSCAMMNDLEKEMENVGVCFERIDGNGPHEYTITTNLVQCSGKQISEINSRQENDKQNQITEKKGNYCQSYATALNLAVTMRSVYSPQQTYSLYKKDYTAFPLPDKLLKKIINDGYFNKDLSTVAGGIGLVSYVYNACLRDWKPEHDWKPLK